MSQHIVSAFDHDLEAVQALVVKMGGMVEAQILDAAQALDTRDADLARSVRERDKAIDALEEKINEEAARLIALRAPAAGDLRTALTLREFEGLSYEDIAGVMQCPVGTVRSRIFRAREAIDKSLQPLLQET